MEIGSQATIPFAIALGQLDQQEFLHVYIPRRIAPITVLKQRFLPREKIFPFNL
jgi:hypothetical protein